MKRYLEADEIDLVFSGSDYFKVLVDMIWNAKEVLHLQTYIFDSDQTGRTVVAALNEAAARGVKVYVMVDAIGSINFEKEVQQELRSAGVHFRFFSPVFSAESVFAGRRLHHKVVVADRSVGLIGGVNIADKYNVNPAGPHWLDFAALTRGQVNEYLHVFCEQFYLRKKRDKLLNWERTFHQKQEHHTDHLIRYRCNDWLRRRNEIHRSYSEAIVRSETNVVM